MQFDHFTVSLLVHNPDGPHLDERAAAALQDAHMAHVADLHAQGHLLAAGPISDPVYRGLSILTVDPEQALALKDADPAVQAGVYTIQVMSWIVPRGAISFSTTHFPRSMDEVRASD